MSSPADDCPWDRALAHWDFLDDGIRDSGANTCEAAVCSWVETPANAHSSWAYAIVGLLVLLDVARRSPPSVVDTRAVGLIAIWLGFGSFFMHASLTFAGQVADLLGMFLIASWMAGRNLQRLGALSTDRSRRTLTTGLVIASLLSMLLLRRGFPAVLVVGSIALGAEWVLHRRGHEPPGAHRPLSAALGCLAVSFVFWGLDLARVACEPDNHVMQGHAAWHVLNAPLFWFVHRFYAGLSAPGIAIPLGSQQREARSHTR